jgi:hypothetical protein
MSTTDSKLDAELRNVRVPDGLLDRLVALPLAGDDGIDEIVRDVAIPPRLLKWLEAIPLTEPIPDCWAALDEALRNVPVPDDLVPSCRHFARRFVSRLKGRPIDRVMRISRFAMAASLILAVSLSLGSAMLMSLVINGIGGRLPPTMVAKDKPPRPIEEKERLEASWGMEQGAGSRDQGLPAQRQIEFAALDGGEAAVRDQLALGTLPSGADPWAVPSSEPVLGNNNWDKLPDLMIRPSDLGSHGLDWPIVPGDNRQFLIRYGFHPFVSPTANLRLQTCQMPLAVEPLSYELTRRYLERNELPPEKRVRTEEFLAAVDYNFARPKNQSLGLVAAGGPSPISGEGYCLLQVGVQARESYPGRHDPKHLVFLVDTSTSMRWGSRMEIVRRALGYLPEIVGPDDRLSLVAFNQAAHVLVESLAEQNNAGHRNALPQFAAAADSLTAGGGTNIIGGLREAYSVARQTLGDGRPAARVVLLTDGLLPELAQSGEELQRLVTEAAQQNIPLDVIDLGQQRDANPQVAALSQAGRGTVHRAVSSEQVRWALREIVTGRSQVVARAARLQVTFNPKSVLEYRLVGHESGDWDGLLPGPLEADFHEGQAATALFEVRIAPEGPARSSQGEWLASVDLGWYPPDGVPKYVRGGGLAGKTAQRTRITIERRQVAASLTTSAPSLQEAAVVAYTAEVLRRSPFIFQSGSRLTTPKALYRAIELSGQTDSQLLLRPSFEQFVAMIRQGMKAHPARRPTKD